jgi:hypothetical protein
MPFHVQVERGHRRAAIFNLDPERLAREVVGPWVQGRRLALGDREWQPRDSAVTILEGPELAAEDLAHGRGWDRALSSSRDVTADVLDQAAAPRVAVLAGSPADEQEVGAALARNGVDVVGWADVRAAITSGRAGSLAGIVVAVAIRDSDPGARILFDAGLAAGALRGRAVVVCLGGATPPAELDDLLTVSLDPEDDEAVRSLTARLR